MEMNLFNQYQEHYINKSEETIGSYEVSVRQYYEFCQEKFGWDTEEKIVKSSTWSEVTLFRNFLVQKGLNPYSVNVRISGLRGFFKFLVLTHYISENPAEQVENVGTQDVEQTKDYLTEVEFKHLIKTIQTPSGKKQDRFSFTSARDAFMVGLMVTGGFRISEILSMKLGQIDVEKKDVKVVGKGKKLRSVPVSDSVIRLMNEYLAEREAIETDCDKLFINIKGTGLTRQGTNKNLKKYTERAGIQKDITNHSLRHTAITNMIDKGVGVERTQVIVGHSDSATTSRYYKDHLSTSVPESYFPEF